MTWTLHGNAQLLTAITCAASALVVGCASDDDSRLERTVAAYGERLENSRQISERHEVEVSEAESDQEVTDAEQHYADEMQRALADMDQMITDMGVCPHHEEHAHNTATLHDDVAAMRSMYLQHHDDMSGSADLDAAHTEEASFQRDLGSHHEVWSTHHREMTAHASDCPCGNMGGGMMDN